jgi:hypothetical protein
MLIVWYVLLRDTKDHKLSVSEEHDCSAEYERQGVIKVVVGAWVNIRVNKCAGV